MTRQDNRAKCPQFAKAMDDVRAVWPDARVRYVEEAGVTLGAIPQDQPNWVEQDAATIVWAAGLGGKRK